MRSGQGTGGESLTHTHSGHTGERTHTGPLVQVLISADISTAKGHSTADTTPAVCEPSGGARAETEHMIGRGGEEESEEKRETRTHDTAHAREHSISSPTSFSGGF